MPDENVFCRKCGAKIYAGAKICSNCGVKQFILEKKNPIQALILSALVVGLGQIYNQDYWKGIMFIASMVLGRIIWLTIPQMEVNARRVTMGVMLIIWILNITDAYKKAKQLNSKDSVPKVL